MKVVKFIALAVLSTLVFSIHATAQPVAGNKTIVKDTKASSLAWKNETIDLGNIPQGKPVTVEFEFTNSGKDPVLIATVGTSCGCTVPDYSKKPILPKETSSIKATYNAANPGAFDKTITVTLSDNEIKPLHLKGTVIKP